MKISAKVLSVLFLASFLAPAPPVCFAQANIEQRHVRGKLWETVYNDGWVGSLGAWDFLVSTPLGMYPGFPHWTFPTGNEELAVNTFANANFHNFRSGVWIVAKNVMTAAGPPDYRPYAIPYEIYASGLQALGYNSYGTCRILDPLLYRQNFLGSAEFNPSLPEEMTDGFWYTNTCIKVTRRSYAWSYPGYRDFIIYDYTFKHTGQIVSIITHDTIPNPDVSIRNQTLNGVFLVFHSAVSVSTKSQINLYCDLDAVQAGAFGWLPETYHDFYHIYDGNTLFFSTNYNGGTDPTPWGAAKNCVKPNREWTLHYGPELMSPSAFGWTALYADPTGTTPRTSPKPDFYRIDSHKNSKFNGADLDLQMLTVGNYPTSFFYTFAQTTDTVPQLGNQGNRLNIYTMSYGPYTFHPGDSVRIIVAEVAGVMDYNRVVDGDSAGWRDSAIASIRLHAANARNAVSWGMGATVNGMPLAAAVPPPPPAPQTKALNASVGTIKAIIGVSWDKIAETATIMDGPGNGHVFYNGLTDLAGYRVYRSTDFQYAGEGQDPVFRGAAWKLLADIPKSDFATYVKGDSYEFSDSTIAFGSRCAYYVSAYRNAGATWISPNGTTVGSLPEMESGDVNHSNETSAKPGPMTNFDIFVVPNPHVLNDPKRNFGTNDPYRLQFYNLPEECVIRIYTVMGDLVKTIQHRADPTEGVSGSEVWNQRSDSGLRVAPGLYIYNVESTTAGVSGTFTGKLMIVR